MAASSEVSQSKPDGLVRHSVLLFLAAQIANVSNILFHVVMGRQLQTDYSTLLTMLNIMLIIGIPLEALRTSAAHFSARALQANRPGDIHGFVRIWGRRFLGFGCVLGVAMFLMRDQMAVWLHLDSTRVITVTAFTIPGLFLIPILGGVLQGIQSFVWMALALQSHSILRFVGGALVVWLAGASALSGLAGQVMGVAFAVSVGWAGYRLQIKAPASSSVSLEGSGSYLAWSVVSLSAFALLMMLDVMLVKHFVNDEAEVFSRAATLARSIVFLPMPIAFAMFPKVVSGGHLDEPSRRIFWKAIFIVLGLLLCAVIGCAALPWLPYQILYGTPPPDAAPLVRGMVLALMPLALVYMLVNFEMAQRRFSFVPFLLLGAVLYITGAFFRHDTSMDIILALGIGSTVAAAGLIATLPWKQLLPGRRTHA